MVEKSVHKHMRYDKHLTALSAFYAARAASTLSPRLTVVNSPIGDTSDDQLESNIPEVYEDAQTTAAWCRWEGLDNEPNVTAGTKDLDGSEEELEFSTDSCADSTRRGYLSDSELSAYDSNNEVDNEEWDLPNSPSAAEQHGSYAASHDEEPGGHRRYRPAANPWWPYKNKEVKC
ncbi:hypothetical protein PGT21_011813 [Puccinia graminis f. sp. tritici]|uniref:Uncharacterized protein n=1 Tax=Puccinia graminis f. sp. tritici TaxID=56615 RepID=A0A5B0LYF6_PUCGR|nr:hypothetical protein PGT21_011813 [Puccinia graminis f. sp. tritici]